MSMATMNAVCARSLWLQFERKSLLKMMELKENAHFTWLTLTLLWILAV